MLAQLRNDLVGVRDFLTPQDFEDTAKNFRREWNTLKRQIIDTIRALSAQRDHETDPLRRTILKGTIDDLKSRKTRMIADKEKMQDRYMYNVLSALIQIRRGEQQMARRRLLQKRHQFRQANFPEIVPPNQSIIERARREARAAYRTRAATYVPSHRIFTPRVQSPDHSYTITPPHSPSPRARRR